MSIFFCSFCKARSRSRARSLLQAACCSRLQWTHSSISRSRVELPQVQVTAGPAGGELAPRSPLEPWVESLYHPIASNHSETAKIPPFPATQTSCHGGHMVRRCTRSRIPNPPFYGGNTEGFSNSSVKRRILRKTEGAGTLTWTMKGSRSASMAAILATIAVSGEGPVGRKHCLEHCPGAEGLMAAASATGIL